MKTDGLWLNQVGFLQEVGPKAREQLACLTPVFVPKDSVIFQPGDEPENFVLVISGKVGVYLTAKNGREVLLYSVSNGQTCIQTTIGLVGGNQYMGQGIAETDLSVVLIPRSVFSQLLEECSKFRQFVFRAFGERLGEVTELLEQIAFVTIEKRLAGILLERIDANGEIKMTHQDLSVAIGSAREVVTRRLETFRENGIVQLDRGSIKVLELKALEELAAK